MSDPVFLVGPTGVGKSKAAMLISEKTNAEIVSCDSMQVYKGMDIGTDKPSLSDRKKVVHHMLDVIDINKEYDVFQYKETASKIISDIQKRDKLPLVVGGTGLYVKALVDGLFDGPERNDEIRKKIEEKIEKDGLDSVYAELKNIDSSACEKINPKDKRRILRALEVYYITGRPISSFQTQWNNKNNSTIIGLNREKGDLHKRIDTRVEDMFNKGLVEETKCLLDKGLNSNKNASKALGYKEVIDYLNRDCSLDEAKEIVKRNTRKFAKRQLTWFRKDDRVKWIIIESGENVEATVKKILDLTLLS